MVKKMCIRDRANGGAAVDNKDQGNNQSKIDNNDTIVDNVSTVNGEDLNNSINAAKTADGSLGYVFVILAMSALGLSIAYNKKKKVK